MAFAPFRAATQAKAPQLAAAQAQDDKIRAQQAMQANALRSQNMLGAGLLYNAGMGENSPIADYLFDEAATSAPSGEDWLGATGQSTPPVDAASAGNAGTTTADAYTTIESVDAANAAYAANTANAGGGANVAGGANAGMMSNPYGWAIAALMADETMNEGRVREDLFDPKKYEEGIGYLFGKDLLWS